MAQAACEHSDKAILTSDNPRSEDPEEILNEMEAGLTGPQKRKSLRVTNRKEAIKVAVSMAQPGDVVLVAGKGHETYQEIKGIKHHFDDREVLTEAFETLNK
jgi:UDP-N-acetylmuramoyl-L-alanyl-D-glutamate--2,6-diaminopimelate ligase